MDVSGVEREAMTAARLNKPSPPGDLLDSMLYMALYSLYSTFYAGQVARENASEIKRQMVADYERRKRLYDFRTGLLDDSVRLWRAVEGAARDYKHDRTLENADRLWEAIYGRTEKEKE